MSIKLLSLQHKIENREREKIRTKGRPKNYLPTIKRKKYERNYILVPRSMKGKAALGRQRKVYRAQLTCNYYVSRDSVNFPFCTLLLVPLSTTISSLQRARSSLLPLSHLVDYHRPSQLIRLENAFLLRYSKVSCLAPYLPILTLTTNKSTSHIDLSSSARK